MISPVHSRPLSGVRVRSALWRLCAITVMLAGAVPASAADPVADLWPVQVPEFRADAPEEGTLTVLYFTATWCGFCRQMERTTLSNSSVRTRLEAFTRVKIDYDQQPELVARYHVSGVPAFVMVNVRGEEISRLVGATEPDPFRGWLADGKTHAAELAQAAVRRQSELKQLTETLAAASPEAWAQVRTRVFELAARGEGESRDFALAQLAARAELEPSTLFDGLLHPDLAVRLAVAGVLRKKLGRGFVFDPWADAETRAKVVGDERFTMLADGSISVEVEARFIDIEDAPPEGGALDVLIKAAGQPAGLTPAQLGAALAELAKRKGAPVVSSPRATMGSGNPARMVIGQEMRYPIRWEKKANAGWVPAEFATRTVGVELAVTPRVRANRTIGLSVAPQATAFEGFLEFAEAGDATAGASQAKPEWVTLNGKSMPMKAPFTPVFVVRAATADLKVPIGNTAVMRGGEPHRLSWTITGDLVTETVSRTSPTTSWILVTAKIERAKR